MINKKYRESAITTYGDKCEICGYGLVEVHHIDYQEHQEVEDYIRYLQRNNQDITAELEKAIEQGYDEFKNGQLSKNDSTKNLSCLCPNHHTLIHTMDVGKKLLKALNPRK